MEASTTTCMVSTNGLDAAHDEARPAQLARLGAGVDAVGVALLLAQLAEEPRGGAAAQHLPRSGVPIGSSNTPGCSTSPLREYSLVPVPWPLPRARNHAAPCATICGTLAMVSTLLINVGQPCTPACAG